MVLIPPRKNDTPFYLKIKNLLPYLSAKIKTLGLSLIVLGILSFIGGLVALPITGNPLMGFLIGLGFTIFVLIGIFLLKKSSKIPDPKESLPKREEEEPVAPIQQLTPEKKLPDTTDITTLLSSSGFSTQRTCSFFQDNFIFVDKPTNYCEIFRTKTDTIRLICAKRVMDLPPLPIKQEVGIIFNMTLRADLDPKGLDVSTRILSKAVTTRSWKNSSPLTADSKQPRPLKEGEVSIGTWESTPEHLQKIEGMNSENWSYLGHILKPDWNSVRDPIEVFEKTKKGIQNAVLTAVREKQCCFIQFHLIPSGKWKAAIASAFFEAIVEMEKAHTDLLKNVTISVVSQSNEAFKEFTTNQST